MPPEHAEPFEAACILLLQLPRGQRSRSSCKGKERCLELIRKLRVEEEEQLADAALSSSATPASLRASVWRIVRLFCAFVLCICFVRALQSATSTESMDERLHE